MLQLIRILLFIWFIHMHLILLSLYLFRLLVKYMNMYQVLLCPLQPLLQYGQHLKAWFVCNVWLVRNSKNSPERNYFISRFVSMLYTIIFTVALASTMVLLVFGNKLFNLAMSLAPWLRQISIVTLMLRYLLVFLLLVLFFSLILQTCQFLMLATFWKSIFRVLFSQHLAGLFFPISFLFM